MSYENLDTLNYQVEFNPFATEQANLNELVLSSFIDANRGFLKEDTKASRNCFIPLASVGLVRFDDHWLALSNRDQLFELDAESVHRIVVAKILTDYPLGPTLINPNLFKEYDEWLKKQNENPTFNIYPNPTRDLVNVDITDNGVVYEYSIISNLGTTLKNGRIASGQNIIDLQSLDVGVYYLRINSNGSILTKRIVKSGD